MLALASTNHTRPISTTARRTFALGLLLACAAGCTEDNGYVDVGDRDNRNRGDGGAHDGSPGGDGGPGSGGDGGPGSGGDGGSLADGALGDGGAGGDDEDGGRDSEIDTSRCSLTDQDDYEAAVPFVEGGFAIAPGPVDFGLTFISQDICPHAVETAVVDSSGAAIAPVTALEGCDVLRELTLASTADGWQLAWTDNSSGAIDLHTARLDESLLLASPADRVQVTDSAMESEERPAIADVAGGALLAWHAEGVGTRRILSKRVGASGEPVEVVPDSAGHAPIELALAQIGLERAAVAWVEETANRGIWVQTLDADGEAIGSPVRMTDYAAPGSTVDLATRADEGGADGGGAAAYSVGIDQVNFEIRFRRLAADATLRGEEIKIISSPLQAKDAGIARLGNGYVIAYRAIPDGNVIRDPQIRAVFLSKEGLVNRDAQGRVVTFPITDAARDGSRVQVEVSVDGQLLVAFVDGSDQEANRLRVVRRRLDCGL